MSFYYFVYYGHYTQTFDKPWISRLLISLKLNDRRKVQENKSSRVFKFL